ncbi:hypothetical protein LZK76_10400 [Rhizobium leguminosarum]|nr:hypothetical protein LZK76_10400 [Rhizobium leguminosarum]
MADIDLALLAQQNAEILEELRALRREVAELEGTVGPHARFRTPKRPAPPEQPDAALATSADVGKKAVSFSAQSPEAPCR